jgi:hypothetical protein
MNRQGHHVYFLKPVGERGPIKIGYSCEPPKRLISYQCWSPVRLELVAKLPGGSELEGRFHAAFFAHHLHGEWFEACPELLAAIEQIKSGDFDVTTLPATRDIRRRRGGDHAVLAAALDFFNPIIRRWPTLVAFATEVGCPEKTAREWLRNDSIPSTWVAAVVRAASSRGWTDISADLLAILAEQRRLNRPAKPRTAQVGAAA